MRFGDLANRFRQGLQKRNYAARQPAEHLPLGSEEAAAEIPLLPVDFFYANGQRQLQGGHYADAEDSFRMAMAEISSGLRWPWIGVVRALCCQGKHSQAVQETLAIALGINDSQERPAVSLPWWLFAGEGVNEQIAQDLREVVRRYPAAEDAWLSLSFVENKCGNYAAGVQAMQMAAALHWPRENGAGALSNLEPREQKRPSFLIIGQPKTGTTALYEMLACHDHIDAPLIKEPCYWCLNHECMQSWYQANFPPRWHRPEAITFEASTSTFAHPLAAARLAAQEPAIRLILILRDPVERIFSEYNQYFRLGYNQRNWEKTVDQEINLIGDCPLTEADLESSTSGDSFLLRGATLPHLQRWLRFFLPEQLLILEHHQLNQDPARTAQQIYDFLSIPDQPGLLTQRVNEGWYQPMLPSTEKRLRAWLAEHNRQLQELIDGLQEARVKS
jgi:hypothetical protein